MTWISFNLILKTTDLKIIIIVPSLSISRWMSTCHYSKAYTTVTLQPTISILYTTISKNIFNLFSWSPSAAQVCGKENSIFVYRGSNLIIPLFLLLQVAPYKLHFLCGEHEVLWVPLKKTINFCGVMNIIVFIWYKMFTCFFIIMLEY